MYVCSVPFFYTMSLDVCIRSVRLSRVASLTLRTTERLSRDTSLSLRTAARLFRDSSLR